ncbi:uncharacterized protein [Temnothorax longispinosus]|uniref:uncharacterized protein n=1 Tax=Temnothorax longispinosus TaxID=300112 RepID=UPI003A9955F3
MWSGAVRSMVAGQFMNYATCWISSNLYVVCSLVFLFVANRLKQSEIMSKVCCIVNCESKCPNLNSNKRTLFGFPKDSHENQIWIDKISPFLSKGNATRKYLRICDKHFKDNDVERTFRTVLKDGTINEVPREKFKLNQGSVPCIFDVHQDNFEEESMDAGDESLCRIAENILLESFPFIGCQEHKGALTKRVIHYYTLSRAHILSKTYNKIYDEKKVEMQKHRKQSKLGGKSAKK